MKSRNIKINFLKRYLQETGMHCHLIRKFHPLNGLERIYEVRYQLSREYYHFLDNSNLFNKNELFKSLMTKVGIDIISMRILI